MDYNNNNTSPTRELPLGFGFALARNEKAMQRYAELSESEKQWLYEDIKGQIKNLWSLSS